MTIFLSVSLPHFTTKHKSSPTFTGSDWLNSNLVVPLTKQVTVKLC